MTVTATPTAVIEAYTALAQQYRHAVAKILHGVNRHVIGMESMLMHHTERPAKLAAAPEDSPELDAYDNMHERIAAHVDDWRSAVSEVMQAHPTAAKFFAEHMPQVHEVYLGERDARHRRMLAERQEALKAPPPKAKRSRKAAL